METKTRLSTTTPCLLTRVSLRPRFLRKTNVMTVVERAIQPLGSMLLRLPRKIRIKIRLRTSAISNIILANKKVTMPISVLKSQKTSNGLGDFYVDDCQENGGKIRIDTLYLVSHNLQKSNQYPAILRKRSQYNEPSFCLPVRPQDLKNQRFDVRKSMTLI